MRNQFPLFDSHFHIIDPRFPLIANQGYVPDEFSCEDYLAQTADYNICGGALVSGSFQGFDQNYLIDVLQQLGDRFVGVTQIPMNRSDTEIMRLQAAGVRALRFNMRRGGSEALGHLSAMAQRVYDLVGWHVELYIDAKNLACLQDTLLALPAVSIDHLGLSKEGLPLLSQLVEQGVRVKATGFGRVDFDQKQALKQLYAANPHALMFGTDLPSTRAPRAYEHTDFLSVIEVLGEAAARRVLCENAMSFYRLA